MPLLFPVINGKVFSWANVEIDVDGQIHTGIVEINWQQGLKPGDAVGTGVYVQGDTVGEYERKADMTMNIQSAAALRKSLAAKHPNGSYGLVLFPVLVQFDNGVDAIHEVKLVGCRIADEDNSNSRSPDPTLEKIGLWLKWIEKDGLRMLATEDA